MIHKYAVVIELSYDDSEYTPPSLKNIEQMVSNALWRSVLHAGFDKGYQVEAAKGTLAEAFGLPPIVEDK